MKQCSAPGCAEIACFKTKGEWWCSGHFRCLPDGQELTGNFLRSLTR